VRLARDLDPLAEDALPFVAEDHRAEGCEHLGLPPLKPQRLGNRDRLGAGWARALVVAPEHQAASALGENGCLGR
jgi:hypothetical protein